MVTLFCEACSYRFKHSDKKPKPTKCGYCGSQGTIKEIKQAQDFIDEL